LDVGGWLRGLGLDQYEQNFRDDRIDASVLPHLTVEDLKELGVASVGDRRKLLTAISALASSTPFEQAASPQPSLAPPKKVSEVRAERRPITVMFCDLVGSTGLAAGMDAEDWRNLVGAWLDAASAAVTGLGGHVSSKLGDGLMALFGYPLAQENDAERAVRAALAIQRALAEINARNATTGAPELIARVGIDCGAVVVDATGEVFGDAPNVAARVQAAADPGTVVVTAAVQRLIAGLFVAEDMGVRELKGVPRRVTLYRIVRASGGRRFGGHALTPLVGREEELDLLRRRWERAARGEGQFVQIVGEPGIGKSRLVDEFRLKLGEAPHTFVEWSSSQLLQNTPLHPLAEWGRQRFGADETAAQRLADLENTLRLIGLDPAEYAPLLAPLVDIPLPAERAAKLAPEELRRRQLAAMTAWVLAGARSQPVALAFEDLHWADPTTLDLMRALAERGAQAPLLILATTRPDFRAPWSLRSHHNLMSLSPLGRAEVTQMVGELAARHALSKEVVEGVTERTGGVPLFVEEVTRLLLERGEAGGLQEIPLTLQQSLAARLDRLGEAREVAQIGAVLGRDFAYPLLRDVAEMHEPALQAALERLVEADLLFVNGVAPQASFRFRHALVQDATYESLLKSRRQALHRRTAEVMIGQPEHAAAEPEVIAHHFTEAGLDDLAIEWWGKAGDQALRRSAFQEAISHLGKAIAMADTAASAPMPRGAEHAAATNQRLKLRSDYASAVMLSKGYAAEETKVAFARAVELAGGAENAAERFSGYWVEWVRSFVRADLRLARTTAETFLREAEEGGYATEAGVARRGLGVTYLYQGDLAEARTHLERALTDYRPDRDAQAQVRFGMDTKPVTTAHLALAMWHSGEVEHARQLAAEAVQNAAELAHAPTSATTYLCVMFLEARRDAVGPALRSAETVHALGRERGMDFFVALSGILGSWARGRLYEPEVGAQELRKALAHYVNQGNKLRMPWFHGLLAELEAVTEGPEAALALIDRGLAIADETGEHLLDPYLHRLRGDILLKRESADPAGAEDAYRTAIDIANRQGSRSYALLGALSVAKLYQSTGRPADAYALLAPALEGFAPTPEMPEIAEAMSLLAVLQETDAVKADAAQRRRMAQLRVAYGNALFTTRRASLSEAAQAFARAREEARGEGGAPERLAADYGLWVGSYQRGDLSAMRIDAAAFLSDVDSRPHSPEASVAHRAAGLTHWFAGEYLEAREHLEQALYLFQTARDDDLALRFGFLDSGVGAMALLPMALWPLGDVERAVSLVRDADARNAALGHVGTRAYGKSVVAMFELMRGDLSRAASNGVELVRLAREHDLSLVLGLGVFLEGVATAESGAAADGLEQMRRSELLREPNVASYDGVIKIALAQAEARAGGVDRAIAIVDEALATVQRTGCRAFAAELNRVHGELLLRRNPADSASSERALEAAIAIAREQRTRSFELRAALSLSKLNQSTGRPNDARAVLAAALEGFAPTPEMPEIAEAQALLVALAETEETKADIAQRERRLHLQTSYSQAVMFSRGFAAEETKDAFARARELAGGTENLVERFPTHFAQWVRSLARGEHRQAQKTAEIFLREAEEGGYAIEAGFARRCLGASCYYQGKLLEARTHLERARADYRPERDAQMRFRFGHDVGVLATANLASTTWHLGQVERARRLAEQAVQSANELGHVPSGAFAHAFKTGLEVLRDDPSAALRSAETLLALAREHGMGFFVAAGEAYAGWARGRLEDPHAGAQVIRRTLAEHFNETNRINAPLFHGLLAELEAETRGPDAALTLIGHGLSVAQETGEQYVDPYLHRIRGDNLLKRDPTNPAPAEDAYRTAIAIAKQQSARSYELLATLSLARLYRSTARLVEAHDVLSPALEGFSPTPEMPEIAEAQALLAALAANEPDTPDLRR
jgi:class 3 adenylate cyclase/predicted ATPase